ncbi:MAG: hypothetical protein EOP11_00680 [Proteobacteria bacterium]|nr:MAG: hypothetical protein EOP11_00680 [Pseudomonadota bacterium]
MQPLRALNRYQDAIFAHDPGFNRLRLATQGTVSVAVSFFLLAYIFRYGNQSATLALAGVTLSMMACLVVSDDTRAEQKRTVLWMPVPAIFVLTIGLLLKPWPALDLIVFLAVVFGSVYIRRYGPRGMAIGMICFMSYFYSIFFPIPMASLAWVIFSILVGLGVVYVIRFWLSPEHPRFQLEWALRAFRVRAAELLELAHHRLSEGSIATSREDLSESFLRLNEAALQVDDFLKNKTVRSAATEAWVFDLELSIRRFIENISALSLAKDLPDETKNHLPQLLSQAAELVRRPRAVGSRIAEARMPSLPAVLTGLGEAVVSECDRLLSISFGPRLLADGEGSPELVPDPAPTMAKGLHKNTKQAIQVTIAAGSASLVGALISPTRWYWAALTAFIVFSGATRGDTILRAVQRVLGTVAGLIAGFALAYAFTGNREVQGGLVFVCIFFGLYCARVVPTGTVFWFTSLLAVFYQLMGMLTQEVLILRLEETLVGAVAGTIAAAWVFPTSTRSAVRAALVVLVNRGAQILEESGRLPADGGAHYLFFRRLRLLDRDLVSLRAAAAPMTGKIVATAAPDTYRRLHDASALVHYLRQVAFAAANDQAFKENHGCRERCLNVAAELKGLAGRVERREKIPLSEENPWPAQLDPGPAGVESMPHWLNRIEQLVRSLSR